MLVAARDFVRLSDELADVFLRGGVFNPVKAVGKAGFAPAQKEDGKGDKAKQNKAGLARVSKGLEQYKADGCDKCEEQKKNAGYIQFTSLLFEKGLSGL